MCVSKFDEGDIFTPRSRARVAGTVERCQARSSDRPDLSSSRHTGLKRAGSKVIGDEPHCVFLMEADVREFREQESVMDSVESCFLIIHDTVKHVALVFH